MVKREGGFVDRASYSEKCVYKKQLLYEVSKTIPKPTPLVKDSCVCKCFISTCVCANILLTF